MITYKQLRKAVRRAGKEQGLSKKRRNMLTLDGLTALGIGVEFNPSTFPLTDAGLKEAEKVDGKPGYGRGD